jgi:diamine N-acetyltransferase
VHGFSDTTTGTVRLIVRKNNPRAKRLYEEMHFRNTGECMEEIQGKPVEFYRMEINRIAFYGADA